MEPLLAHGLATVPQGGSSAFTPGPQSALDLYFRAFGVSQNNGRFLYRHTDFIAVLYRFRTVHSRVDPACGARNLNSGAFWCVLVRFGAF